MSDEPIAILDNDYLIHASRTSSAIGGNVVCCSRKVLPICWFSIGSLAWLGSGIRMRTQIIH